MRFSPVERHGRLLLLALFVTLLAGRFTPARIGFDSTFDLRVIGAGAVTLAYVLWVSVAAARTRKLPVGVFGGWFAGFCAWLALTALWTPSGARVTGRLTDLAFMALLVLLALQVGSRLPDTGQVWRWTWVAGIAYFVAAIAAGPGDQGRYAALGGGPNVFVRIMILGAVAAIALAVLKGASWTLWSLPLFAAGVVLSGSRGGLVAFAGVAVAGAIPVLRRLKRRGRRQLAAAIAVAGIPALWVLGPRLAPLWHERFVQQTFVDRYASSRDTLTSQAWQMFQDHPLVGAGLDGFHATYPQWPYPHNLLLGAGAEGGTVAVALLLIPMLVIVAAIWRARPLRSNVLFLLLAGLALLVASIFSGDFYDTRFMWLFFGLAGIEARRSSVDQVTDSRRAISNSAQSDQRRADQVRPGVSPIRTSQTPAIKNATRLPAAAPEIPAN